MTKKLTAEIIAEENQKLLDAYTDENGKFYIKEIYPVAEGGMHYIVSKNLTLIRLVSEFAKNLIDDGKAILIRKEDWDAFKNSAMKF